MRRPRFCLVTSAHLASNPRLVKEADALAAAGFDVRVVSVDIDARLSAVDADIAEPRAWRLTQVKARRDGGVGPAVRWATDAAAQRVADSVATRGGAFARDLALSRHLLALTRAAAAEPADVVVGHNPPALPVAARAAQRLGASLAFDVEDLHTEEFVDPVGSARSIALIAAAESSYLPRCGLLLASSDGIADAVSERYGVARPVTVLNAFSIAARAVAPSKPVMRIAGRRSVYWFSQTLGPGRGLEDAVDAIAILRGRGLDVELFVRARTPPGTREAVEARAESAGVGSALHLLAPAPPDEMVALCAEHDVGLALERTETLNRALCVSNKLLTYLAAGVPVAATDTPGQRGILQQAPEAGFTYTPGDAHALAHGIESMVRTPDALARAKAAADSAARRRFSWEVESSTLVAAYESLLSGPSPDASERARRRAGAAAGAR